MDEGLSGAASPFCNIDGNAAPKRDFAMVTVGVSYIPDNAEFSERLARAFQLLPAYAHLTGVSINEVQTFAETLMDLSDVSGDGLPGLSGLNGDQAPMQLCIKLASDGARFRLIADPASDDAVLGRRYLRARNALQSTLDLTGTHGLRPIADDLLVAFGPQNLQHLEKFTCGVFWLAASIGVPGAAIYADTSVYSVEEAWDRTQQWFSTSLARSEKAVYAVDNFRHYCWLSSIGIEGLDRDRCRVKLYMRAFKDMPNGLLGNIFPPISELGKSGCFRFVMRDAGISPNDVLFNVGIHAASGEIVNSKIDISGSALGLGPDETDQVVDECCRALNVPGIPLGSLMEDYNLLISFLSVGIDIKRNKNINIYLKGGF